MKRIFNTSQIITAVEIGTSKICVLMGEAKADGNISVIGHGECPSNGALIKGEIANMSQATGLVAEAIDMAVRASGTEIDQDRLYVATGGSHVRGFNGTGSVIINGTERTISRENMDDAVSNAVQISIPPEYMSINTIHGNYLIDGIRRSSNPENQVAGRLDAFAHVICGNRYCVENMQQPLREIGYEKPNPIFSGLASSIGILSDEETRHGVLMLDMGAGTTDYMVFHNSGLELSGSLAVGCDHLANDLSVGLDLNIAICRRIMAEKLYAARRSEGRKFIEIEGAIGTRKIPVDTVEKVIDLRLAETLELIRRMLEERNLSRLINRGVVVTGGGALLPQMEESAGSVFSSAVRTGFPPELCGATTNLASPRYSMIAGLLKVGANSSMLRSGGRADWFKAMDRMAWDAARRVFRGVKF